MIGVIPHPQLTTIISEVEKAGFKVIDEIADAQIVICHWEHSVLIEGLLKKAHVFCFGESSPASVALTFHHPQFWYLPINSSIDEILLLLSKGTIICELQGKVTELSRAIESPLTRDRIVGGSPRIRALRDEMSLIAPLNSTVLITGESGTGKSTIARIIHEMSPRKLKPFVSLSCAALPRELIEAELLGHAKGAYTGAQTSRPGLAEVANGGTLFLDEIGEMPLELQPKLLTFLQDRNIRRIGESTQRQVDVRIVTATNQSLETLISRGQFREDLYFRLNVLRLEAPPLRERKEDIPILAREFLREISDRTGLVKPLLDSETLDALQAYEWPGNVRELQNMLERLCVLGQIGPLKRPEARKFSIKTLHEIEQEAILSTLELTGGDKEKAAKALGVSVKTIYNKLSQYGHKDLRGC